VKSKAVSSKVHRNTERVLLGARVLFFFALPVHSARGLDVVVPDFKFHVSYV